MNWCYLIHFERPLPPTGGGHPRSHYIGYTTNLAQRWVEHNSGHGAQITALAVHSGVRLKLARVWQHGSKSLEIKLKRIHARKLCPYCMMEDARALLEEAQRSCEVYNELNGKPA